MENQTDVTASAGFEDVLAHEVEKRREAIKVWNERVAAFRELSQAPIPRNSFSEHPAHGDLTKLLCIIFPGAEAGEINDWAASTLSKIDRDEAGHLTFDGKGRNVIRAWIDCAKRAADVAANNCNFLQAGLADQNRQLGEALDFLFWEDVAAELPIVVAIREARYG